MRTWRRWFGWVHGTSSVNWQRTLWPYRMPQCSSQPSSMIWVFRLTVNWAWATTSPIFHFTTQADSTVFDAGGDEYTGAVLHHKLSGLLQQCPDRRQQSVATEDAGDTECRSSFHHWSQEVRAHDASVTQPSLATVCLRIKFKTAILVYKCLHGMAPPYLTSYCTPVSAQTGHSNLRSTTTGQFVVPRTRTVYGSRSFAVHSPVVLNCLPAELRSPDMSLGVFRKQLNTHTCLTASSAFAELLNLRYKNVINNNKSSATA